MQAMLVAMVCSACWCQAGSPDTVARELEVMVHQGDRYSPAPLHFLGVKGVVDVYDQLLPESKEPRTAIKPATASAAQIDAWIAQLGDETYLVRETATQELIKQGRAVRAAVEVAQKSADPEVKLRAKIILALWEKPLRTADNDTLEPYVAGLQVYFRSISNRECVPPVAERTANLLTYGLDDDGSARKIVSEGLRVVARRGDNALCERFLPYLDHQSDVLAVTVAEGLCAGRSVTYFPNFVLPALASKRDEIALAGIAATIPCNDEKLAPLVHERLRTIFKTRRGELRLQACLPLLHEFNDADAQAYLLRELASEDADRRRRALFLLFNASKPGRAATDELLQGLEPWLTEPDHVLRTQAAKTLLKHSGENVIRRAIEMLGDHKALLVVEVGDGLRQQPDQALVKRLLTEAATSNSDVVVAKEARALLKKLP